MRFIIICNLEMLLYEVYNMLALILLIKHNLFHRKIKINKK